MLKDSEAAILKECNENSKVETAKSKSLEISTHSYFLVKTIIYQVILKFIVIG